MHLRRYVEKGKINQAEFDYINSDDEPVKEEVKAEAEVPAKDTIWYQMLTYRQTWSFVMGKFMTDGIWWFLLWLPTYIKQQFCAGMSPEETNYTVMISFVVFGIAIIGSVYGGALPHVVYQQGVGQHTRHV